MNFVEGEKVRILRYPEGGPHGHEWKYPTTVGMLAKVIDRKHTDNGQIAVRIIDFPYEELEGEVFMNFCCHTYPPENLEHYPTKYLLIKRSKK